MDAELERFRQGCETGRCWGLWNGATASRCEGWTYAATGAPGARPRAPSALGRY